MTTSNAIEVASIPSVLSIPLEAVTADSGYSYVYKKAGHGVVRQMIETGAMNDNEIIVRRGLTKDDQVYLTAPADKENIKTEVIPGLKPAVPGTTGDTAKAVTLPVKPTAAPPAGMKPMPVAKPKG